MGEGNFISQFPATQINLIMLKTLDGDGAEYNMSHLELNLVHFTARRRRLCVCGALLAFVRECALKGRKGGGPEDTPGTFACSVICIGR